MDGLHRRQLLVCLAFAIALFLGACGGDTTITAAAEADQPTAITIDEMNTAHFVAFDSELTLNATTGINPSTGQIEMTVQLTPGASIDDVRELLEENGFDDVLLSAQDLPADFFEGEIRVIWIDRPEPGVMQLGVESCNATHEVVVTSPIDGRYTVLVERTSPGSPGDDCLDIVEVAVDPDLETLEIEDLISGEVFPWPTTEPPTPVSFEGRWAMTEVNGEPVEPGVNTQSIPEFTIDAGFLTGNFGCNGGGGELLLDGTQLRGFVGGDEELCTTPDSDELVPTERLILEMLNSNDGATVTLVGDEAMIWQRGNDELVFQRV